MGGHVGCCQTKTASSAPCRPSNSCTMPSPRYSPRSIEVLMAAVAALLQGRAGALPARLCLSQACDQANRPPARQSAVTGRAGVDLLGHAPRPAGVTQASKHPSILVDWSPIDAAGKLFLLRAAIRLAGRSLPVCEVVHPREGCPRCQKRLLEILATMLPVGCTPTPVTDAGFRRP